MIFHKRMAKGGCGTAAGWLDRARRAQNLKSSAQKYNVRPVWLRADALQQADGRHFSMKSEAGTFRIHATVPRFSRVLRKNYMGLGYVLQATGFRLQTAGLHVSVNLSHDTAQYRASGGLVGRCC